MKYTMDRHRHDNGFTMVEILIVLAISICLIGMIPFIKGVHHSMYLNMEALRERLIFLQGTAMRTYQDIKVEFQGTDMIFNNQRLTIGMRCDGFVVFHKNGNVDRAKTLRCHAHNQIGEIVIQLGSGRMYVKK